jgi:hypothetical protein
LGGASEVAGVVLMAVDNAFVMGQSIPVIGGARFI